MARIKIKDLPKDRKITKEEMKKVFGGLLLKPSSPTLQSPTKIDSEKQVMVTLFGSGLYGSGGLYGV
jgi:hypothetical protein